MLCTLKMQNTQNTLCPCEYALPSVQYTETGMESSAAVDMFGRRLAYSLVLLVSGPAWHAVPRRYAVLCTVPVLIISPPCGKLRLSASGNHHDGIQCLRPISHLSCAMQISALHTHLSLQNDQMHASRNTTLIFSLVTRSGFSRKYLFPSYFHKK
jgi:hypothetical protein